MADSSDILGVLLGQERREDPVVREQRSFARARSTVQDYYRLMSGSGYDFYAEPSPVSAVAHAKRPLIPMMISIVPPDNYPTGETTTREIPSPSTAEISLTTLQERVAPATISPRRITRVVPVDSQVAEEVGQLRDSLEGTTGQERLDIEAQINSLLAQVPTVEVEVPQSTPQGREDQVRRTQEYLDSLRDRYDDFQRASRSSRDRLSQINTPITGPNSRERRDPWAPLADIDDERKRRVVADLLYLREQALVMKELPPLFMYVNPNTFGLSKDHIVSDGSQVRDGFTVEFWGQQQISISASGSVGAFYVDTTDRLGRKSGGLAVSARRGSYAYQQFMSLFQIYRNNAYIYNMDRRIALVGSVSLFYDGVIYTGSFNSLSINHSEDTPFSFNYSFDFTVRYKEDYRRP